MVYFAMFIVQVKCRFTINDGYWGVICMSLFGYIMQIETQKHGGG